MHYRSLIAMSAAAALAAGTTLVTAGASSAVDTPRAAQAAKEQPSGSFAFSGAAAAKFTLPNDVRELRSTTFPDGRTQTRYQQMVGKAAVFGGQITVIEDTAGEAESVIGAYFPGLSPRNTVRVTKAEAREKFVNRAGGGGQIDNDLRLDPKTGRLFYEVESIRDDSRPVRWLDATSGSTLKAYDALAHGEGIGVKGDKKRSTPPGAPPRACTGWSPATTGSLTADVQNEKLQPVVMTDADDIWDLPGNTSPGQAAGVDAHYYANVVDDFYRDFFGRNSIDDNGMQIRSFVHYGTNYCNAFWNGAYMTYGDGNGTTCKSLSGGLDVDAHELTHGVTDYTSNLIYENESGALNEAFSDMMGNTAEFYAQRNQLDRAAKADWLIGEDVINTPNDATPGFRNMGDPKQDGDPSHVSQKYTGDADNGGVHTNSGIANHAYYLTVNGGSNASCTANRTTACCSRARLRRRRPGARREPCGTDLLRGLQRPHRVRQLLRRPQRHRGHGRREVRRRHRQGVGRRRCPHRLHRGHPAPAAVRGLGQRDPADRVAPPVATTVTAPGSTTTARPASPSTSRCSTWRRTTTTSTSRTPPAPRWRRTPALPPRSSTRRASARRPARSR